MPQRIERPPARLRVVGVGEVELEPDIRGPELANFLNAKLHGLGTTWDADRELTGAEQCRDVSLRRS